MSAGLVVVGGGLAAGTLVTELREGGHDGPVVLVTEEPHPPYERPPLSKDLLLGKTGPEKAAVHEAGWYAENDVDLRTGSAATALDRAGRRVRVGDDWLDYDRLVLATGARPRHLPLADESGARVTYLRTLEDATGLREQLRPGTRVVIVGGGWIGLEVASSARQHEAEVTVLESLELPLLGVLGSEVAAVFADLHREHGVDLRTGVTVTGISPRGEGVTVALGDGTAVDGDVLVVGIGVVPNTELAADAGLTVDNGVRTDSRLRTSDENVLAIGDVANADHPVLGHPVRVEHWDTAIQHGKVAAANLLGKPVEHDAQPYFFTDQYDLGMEYVGHVGPDGYDRVVLTGDVPGRVFRAWWVRGEKVIAGMHVNDWDAIDEVRRRVGGPVDPGW